MSVSSLSVTIHPSCVVAFCEHRAYLTCDFCEQMMCGTHAVRLPDWCQQHKDLCETCYAAYLKKMNEQVQA